MSSVYRTHTCGQLRPEHVGQQARLSGWVQRKRDHGNLLFIDLRDHYGVTQVVVDASSPVFKAAEGVRNESVITVTGKVLALGKVLADAKNATAVELAVEGYSAALVPSESGFVVDASATLDAVAGFTLDPQRLIDHVRGGGPVEPVVTIDSDRLAAMMRYAASLVSR